MVTLATSNIETSGYYQVRIDKKSWTKDRVSIAAIEEQGYTVKESRRGDCYRDVFFEGRLVAKLFANKRDALKFIES